MVCAIDLTTLFSDGLLKPSALCDVHGMGTVIPLRLCMARLAGIREVEDKGAAKIDVRKLQPPTDAEDWNSLLQSLLKNLELKLIPALVDFFWVKPSNLLGSAVEPGMNILPTSGNFR